MIVLMIALALAGLLLGALFSGAETGFYRATRLRLVLDAMGGDSVARGLLFLANHPSLFVATALVGNSLANYLVTLAAVVILEGVLPGHLVEWIAPLLLAPVLLVYGELLPKNLFLQAPNRLLRRVGGVFLFFVAALFPVERVAVGIEPPACPLSGRLARAGPLDPRPPRASPRARRGARGGHSSPRSATPGAGIFAIAGRPVGDFLTPMDQLPLATAEMSKQEALALAARRRTAVIPIESAGSLVGYVRVIDLKLSDAPDLGVLRPLLQIREKCNHLAALMRLEKRNESLARVVNARDETLGIITTKRLREPLLDEGQAAPGVERP